MTASVRYGSIAGILALAFAYLFWDASRPFNETDEFWYSEIVQNMVVSGDYLVPRVAGEPDYNKPPLFYWLSVPARKFIADERIAMRLVPGVCFLILLIIVYQIAGVAAGWPIAIVAASIMLLTYDHLHNHGYRSGVLESVLNLQIALVFWLNLGLQRRPSNLLWIGALIGMTFFTKTVFAAIPLVITAANVLMMPPASRPTLGWMASGLIAILTVNTPWFVFFAVQDDGAGLRHMFGDQVVGRVLNLEAASADARTYGRTIVLYPLWQFLTWGQPWAQLTLFSLAALPAYWKNLSAPAQKLVSLCVIWIGFVLIALSFSKSGWGWYISSIYIPSSLLCAVLLSQFVRGLKAGWHEAACAVICATYFILPVAFLANPYNKSSGPDPVDSFSILQIGIAIALVFITLALRQSRIVHWRPKVRAVWAALLVGAIVAPALLIAGGGEVWAIYVAWSVGIAAAFSALLFGAMGTEAAKIRLAMASAPFLLAATLLSAPVIQFANADNRRSEILWMEKQISQAAFASGNAIDYYDVNRYKYIVLVHTFGDRFKFNFEPSARVLTIRPR